MPPQPPTPRVLIIGAGFAGAMTAAWALRHAAQRHAPIRVTLIERTGRFGVGVAYATNDPRHLLNVPAGKMSADPEDPDAFVRWLKHHNHDFHHHHFAPRALYRDYINHLLQEAEHAGPSKLDRITANATELTRDAATQRLACTLDTGERINASAAVLAIGNGSPHPLPYTGNSQQVIQDPWAPAALQQLPHAGRVVLVGTGLTMLDIAVSLGENSQRQLIAVSTRGLTPRPHAQTAGNFNPAQPPDQSQPPARTTRALLQDIRALVREAEAAGATWREAIDSLRHATPQLWSALNPQERRRALRLATVWNVHRHRTAPEPMQRLEAIHAAGRLRYQRGRVTAVQDAPPGEAAPITATLRTAEGHATLQADAVVNCTGPSLRHTAPGLEILASAVNNRLARPDPLALGIETSNGRVLDAQGNPQQDLFAVGSLRRYELWESTAVPELRTQAADIGRRLAQTPNTQTPGTQTPDALSTDN